MLQTVLGPHRRAHRGGVSGCAGGDEPTSGARQEDASPKRGIAFETPPPGAMGDALGCGAGGDLCGLRRRLGRCRRRRSGVRTRLAEEAIWLAGVLAAQAPREPEALGLLALLLHLEARRPARRVRRALRAAGATGRRALARRICRRKPKRCYARPLAHEPHRPVPDSKPRSSPRTPRGAGAGARIGAPSSRSMRRLQR